MDQQTQAVDSISFARVLVEGYKISPRNWLYTSVEKLQQKQFKNEHCIRQGMLKLVSLQQRVDGTYNRRLYDLTKDSREVMNLVNVPRFKPDVYEMQRRLDQYIGPRTRPEAPHCNLAYCGSPQAIADALMQTSTVQSLDAYSCERQATDNFAATTDGKGVVSILVTVGCGYWVICYGAARLIHVRAVPRDKVVCVCVCVWILRG